MAESRPSIKLNFLLSTAYQVLLIILPFITAPYFSRVLTPDGIGINSYTTSYQTYFSMLAALGTMSYGTREIARARDDLERRSRLFWEIELMTVITSLIALAAWVVFILFIPRYKTFYMVLSMGILATMFDISWFFNGLEQFKFTVTRNAVFKILGVICLFLFVRRKEDLLLYTAILTASTLAGSISMWFYVGRFTTKVDFRTLKIRPHFRETLIYFVPSIATSVYTVLDKTLIGAITRNTQESGFYEQTTKMINMMKALTFTSLNNVLGARISYLFEGKKYEEIRGRIRMSINYILFMGVGICFGLIGVAGRFAPLFYGEDYARVGDMLMLMSPIVLIIGISNCLGSQYYTPSGKRSLSARFIVAGSITNLCLNVLLIPRFMGMGAIAASLIAETLITALYLRSCSGYLTLSVLAEDGWKKLAAGALMLLVIRFMDPHMGSNLIAVLLEVPVGGAVYLILLYLMRDSFMKDFIMGRILGGLIRKLKRKGNRS